MHGGPLTGPPVELEELVAEVVFDVVDDAFVLDVEPFVAFVVASLVVVAPPRPVVDPNWKSG
jgi:hypothetical protein